jgi:hypothetical protein
VRVDHAPDVDVVDALDVEDQMGVTRQRPAPQARQVQLEPVPRRARGRVAANVGIRSLQGIDEADCRRRAALLEVAGDGLFDVAVGELARDDGLGFHPPARRRTRSRSASK